MHLSTFLTYGLFAASAVASPTNLMRRGDKIGHDKVVGFEQKVPSGVEGDLMKKYKPYLKVFNGCVPFPAVDAAGNYGGGLKETGSTNGKCEKSTGQVYARAGSGKDGTFGIMYSWYFPKDSPTPGTGHRHDWEEIVVWLDSKSLSANLRGVAYSAHGGFTKGTKPSLKNSGPLVGYESSGLNHALKATGQEGGQQPLIAWDSMTSEARNTLETVSFDKASAKFVDKDNTFKKRMEESFID